MRDTAGNLPAQPDIFPDYRAPIVRNTVDGRELAMVRLGMPSSKQAIYRAAMKRSVKLRAKGREADFPNCSTWSPTGGTTNVRNTSSSHWKP
jgi:putative SOS response-associated peptidase YedK